MITNQTRKKIEVLLSCMFQDGKNIIEKSNIQTDVLVINQCNEDKFEDFHFVNKRGNECYARIIHTKERGLSRSRNLALKNTLGDIVLICDDDEYLEDNYEDTILNAYNEYPQNDIIAFKLNVPNKKYSDKSYNINYFKAAKISSWQLTFLNTERLRKIKFCDIMGSGTGNGAGEENKFIIDCLKHNLKIRYVPYLIGCVAQSESMWFHGYTKKYWQDRGWSSKMIYGYWVGYLYLWYTLILRSWKIDKQHSVHNILIWLHQGFLDKR